MGVWIETPTSLRNISDPTSLLMWECGLKLVELEDDEDEPKSLLMWECGLKPEDDFDNITKPVSLLMWECGLKHRGILG